VGEAESARRLSYSVSEQFDSARHDASSFDCGKDPLNTWIRNLAGQSARRGLARTFVTCDEAGRVRGYYALTATSISIETTTEAVRKRLPPHFPVPAILLARLAVDDAEQGRGLGRSLLADALERITLAAEQVGVRAILVDAIDDDAAAFYRHYGFECALDPRTLLITLADLSGSITAARARRCRLRPG
jgi:GNAT superfamily N-acetyltransferase